MRKIVTQNWAASIPVVLMFLSIASIGIAQELAEGMSAQNLQPPPPANVTAPVPAPQIPPTNVTASSPAPQIPPASEPAPAPHIVLVDDTPVLTSTTTSTPSHAAEVAGTAMGNSFLSLFSAKTVVRIDCGAQTGNSEVPGVGFFGPDNDWHVVNSGSSAHEFDETSEHGYEGVGNSARIWRKPGSYKFEIKSLGAYWLRLYFRAFKSNNSKHTSTDITHTEFSVTVGQSTAPGSGAYNVLKNLNVSYEELRQDRKSLYYEYYLNIQSAYIFVTFTPGVNSPYAFLNGIELVSAPELLYGHAGVIPYTGETRNSNVPVNYAATAMETMFRLNVGGEYINRSDDSGLSRAWFGDHTYLEVVASPAQHRLLNDSYILRVPESHVTENLAMVAPYFAPKEVYATARTPTAQQNLTWGFDVAPGFYYLVRLHFCEIQFKRAGDRLFDIFINEKPSYLGIDIVKAAAGPNKPFVLDFVAEPDNSDHLSVTIGYVEAHHPPNIQWKFPREYHDGIVNGVEVLKLHERNSAASVMDTTPPPPSNAAVNRSLSTAIWVLLLMFVIHFLTNY